VPPESAVVTFGFYSRARNLTATSALDGWLAGFYPYRSVRSCPVAPGRNISPSNPRFRGHTRGWRGWSKLGACRTLTN
jgi:hypothetical protein